MRISRSRITVQLVLSGVVAIALGSCDHGPTTPLDVLHPQPAQFRVFADLSGTNASSLEIAVDTGGAVIRRYELPSENHIVDQTIELPIASRRVLSLTALDDAHTDWGYGGALIDSSQGIEQPVTATFQGGLAIRQIIAEIGTRVLEVRPGDAVVPSGSTAAFSATIVDTLGNSVPTAAKWSTKNGFVATVDSTSGTATAHLAGSTTIQASAAGLLGYAQFQATDTTKHTGDFSPPVLTSFSFTPSSVDVTTDSALVTGTFVVSDSGSGVQKTSAAFGPGCVADTLISGTRTAGTWQCHFYVRRGSTPGAWPVLDYTLSDQDGNTALFAAGWFGTPSLIPLTVVNTKPDTADPAITNLSITPDTIDVSAGMLTVGVNLTTSDVGSGVDSVAVRFDSPDRRFEASCDFVRLVAGTPSAGTWSCPITVNQYVTSGRWQITGAWVVDVSGRIRYYDPGEVGNRGYPTSIQILGGVRDTTPPTLTAFSLMPDSVDVSQDSAVVTARFTAIDAGAGVDSVTMILNSPTFRHRLECADAVLESGTPANGTWSCRLTIPYLAEGGRWGISVNLADRSGDGTNIAGQRLAIIGAPTYLYVVSR